MKFYLFILLFVLSATANAASFDCNKARTFVEKEICKTPVLSQLDDALGKNYKNILNSKLSDVQAENTSIDAGLWLSERNKCKDKICLEKMYRARVDELCENAKTMQVKLKQKCILSNEVK